MFSVGDKVCVCNMNESGWDFHPDLHDGMTGKVVYIEDRCIGIEFDGYIGIGHDCGGNGTYGKCWYMSKEHLNFFRVNIPDIIIDTLI